MEKPRIVIMRLEHPRRRPYSRLYGLLALERDLIRFWRIVPSPPAPRNVKVHLLPIPLGKSRPCVDADVWGHRLLDYRTIFADDAAAMLASAQLSGLERVLQVDNVGLDVELSDLLTAVLGDDETLRAMPVIDVPASTHIADTVLLGADASSAELATNTAERLGMTLRLFDNGRAIYRASAQQAALAFRAFEGSAPGSVTARFAQDRNDGDDVLRAANRLWRPKSRHPYRWFQVAMDDARRLGVKLR